MHRLSMVSLGLLTWLMAASLPAFSQVVDLNPNYTPPRTPWGDPDIQGVFTTDDSVSVSVERPPEFGDRLFLNPEEYNERVQRNEERVAGRTEEFAPADAQIGTGPPAHWLEWGDELSRQTSLIVDPPDGRRPPLTPEGEARQGGGGGRGASPGSPEDFNLYVRCITRGPLGSILPVIYGNGTRIVQSPGYVSVSMEMVHEARIIPIDGGPHADDSIRMYMGDSRGHWEGDTLVVETRNVTDKTGVAFNGTGTRHSEALVITERFTRTGPDRVWYEATYDDPETWTAPWTLGFPLVEKAGYDIYEYACHEGNQQMYNMLSGARADDAAARAGN